jgi:putative transposase
LGWARIELRATYKIDPVAGIGEGLTAGVDLGEVHIAVAHDGAKCVIANGRELHSKWRYQNRLKARLTSKIDAKVRGSRRWCRLVASKRKQLRAIENQVRDVLHKQTTRLVSTLWANGVQTVVIGDVRDIREGLDCGHAANQRIHQMCHGMARHMITHKAARLGLSMRLQDESYTSQTCPACGKRHKPADRQYCCACGFSYHRDGVGAFNIRQKYLGFGPVAGAMASPDGVRYAPHMRCSSAQ